MVRSPDAAPSPIAHRRTSALVLVAFILAAAATLSALKLAPEAVILMVIGAVAGAIAYRWLGFGATGTMGRQLMSAFALAIGRFIPDCPSRRGRFAGNAGLYPAAVTPTLAGNENHKSPRGSENDPRGLFMLWSGDPAGQRLVYWQRTPLRPIERPSNAPAEPPRMAPKVFEPRGAITFPSKPPPTAPMTRPVVPSLRRQ